MPIDASDHISASPEMSPPQLSSRMQIGMRLAVVAVICAVSIVIFFRIAPDGETAPLDQEAVDLGTFAERQHFQTGGYTLSIPDAWNADASLLEVQDIWISHHENLQRELEALATSPDSDLKQQLDGHFGLAQHLMGLGHADDAYVELQFIRTALEEEQGELMHQFLATVVYFQGVCALRQGEDANCIMCRGESSCILPISPSAVHQNEAGSRQAIVHFREYLDLFPDDLEVRWLLNLAHMTLGEYPQGVEPEFLINLDTYLNSEFDIGRFRDVGHIVGCNRLSQAGGAIMEDFDGDGLLDLVVTSWDAKQEMAIYRNNGAGRFEECGAEAGVGDLLGGLNCVQADYNNDGLADIFITRGAWVHTRVRPTLLRNDGNFHFTDVTQEAALDTSVISNSAQWADYDNDGWLDLFVCCEHHEHYLYRNLGNGRFEDRTADAGLLVEGLSFGKGCCWADIDNDDDQDLYISYLDGVGQLFVNNGNGTFSNGTQQIQGGGVDDGFSCWSWDFNNDGWLDIFATCYDRTLADVVRGLIGKPHQSNSNGLYLNRGGTSLVNVTAEMGLDTVFSTMGSNYADFNNDGYLDFYLGTGEPDFSYLVPNRMFLNVAGERFSEITASAGVGHLQKGHGVACGDWDRDGDVDLFCQLGGAVDGDRFHDVLFQNPGHQRHSVTLQLTGVESNRSAIGARIKLVTTGEDPLTVYRHISSGSSFGANPLEQTIGLGDATGVDSIEVHWPTSGTTQVFRDVPVDSIVRITEFEEEVEVISRTPIPLPEEPSIEM